MGENIDQPTKIDLWLTGFKGRQLLCLCKASTSTSSKHWLSNLCQYLDVFGREFDSRKTEIWYTNAPFIGRDEGFKMVWFARFASRSKTVAWERTTAKIECPAWLKRCQCVPKISQSEKLPSNMGRERPFFLHSFALFGLCIDTAVICFFKQFQTSAFFWTKSCRTTL